MKDRRKIQGFKRIPADAVTFHLKSSPTESSKRFPNQHQKEMPSVLGDQNSHPSREVEVTPSGSAPGLVNERYLRRSEFYG